MRAAWYEQPGAATDVFHIGDMPGSEPGSGEVLVRMATSGVNPSDVKTRAGVRGELAFPRLIPHSDGGGTIVATGEGVDKTRYGERVWLWNAAWQRPFGSCSELVALPSEQAVALPDNTDFAAAACLGIPACTAWQGVFGDGPVRDHTVLITGGAGAVGHYAIQFARLGGAKVITTVSSDTKARHAATAGPDAIVNYRQGDTAEQILAANAGRGVDRIVEVEFGGNLPVTEKVLAAGGAIAAYGSMMVPEPALPFYSMMFRSIRLQTFLIYLLAGDARQRLTYALSELLANETLAHPIAAQYALEDTAVAHEAVESGKMLGNVVINI